MSDPRRSDVNARDIKVMRGRISETIRTLASSALDYEIKIPGTHYSGLTNEHLFEILARQGRDFGHNDPTLRKFVRAEMLLALEGATRLPSEAEFDRLAAGFILAWVLKRMDAKVRDIRVRALTERYAASKLKAGFRTPIGTRTGALRDAVSSALVEIQ